MIHKMMICLFLFFIPFFNQAEELLDGIVAIVGDEIILYSELMQTVQGFAIQMGFQPQEDPDRFLKLRDQVLDNLIDDRVLLAKAEEDTITVEEQQVDQELENKINTFVNQLGSREAVEEQFGMSISKIKRDYRDEIRNQMIVQKVRGEKLASLSVSRREVEEFYTTNRDSIPEKKPMVKMRHILMNLDAGDETRQRAFAIIQGVQERLRAGEDFETLAKEISQDPGTAKRGGNLGFVERGMLYPEFEEAAFLLEDGQISDIVETPVGFHIIQMVEKRGERVNVRHILIRLEATEADEGATLAKLRNIRQQAMTGASFAELAKEYSEDESSKAAGGDLGWLPLDMLQIEQFKNLAYQLNVGEISEPFKTQFGYHLILMEDKKPAHKLTLEEDWDEIHSMAMNFKQQKILTEMVDELKKTIFIDIKRDRL